MKLVKSKNQYYLLGDKVAKEGEYALTDTGVCVKVDLNKLILYQEGCKRVLASSLFVPGLCTLTHVLFYYTVAYKIGVHFPNNLNAAIGYYDSVTECFDALLPEYLSLQTHIDRRNTTDRYNSSLKRYDYTEQDIKDIVFDLHNPKVNVDATFDENNHLYIITQINDATD